MALFTQPIGLPAYDQGELVGTVYGSIIGLIIVVILAAVTAGGLAPLLAGVAKNLKTMALRIARAVEELPGKVRRVVTTVRLARSIHPRAVGDSLISTLGKGKDAIRRAVQTARGAARPLFDIRWGGRAKAYMEDWWADFGAPTGPADKDVMLAQARVKKALKIPANQDAPEAISFLVDPYTGSVHIGWSGDPKPIDTNIHPLLSRVAPKMMNPPRWSHQECAEARAINKFLWSSEKRAQRGYGPRPALDAQIEIYTIRNTRTKRQGIVYNRGDAYPACRYCARGAFSEINATSDPPPTYFRGGKN